MLYCYISTYQVHRKQKQTETKVILLVKKQFEITTTYKVLLHNKGSFTNYIQVGDPKMSTFCQRLYHRKCQRRGVGGQKKSQNLVNVVCERPLTPKFQATRETLPPSWKNATGIIDSSMSQGVLSKSLVCSICIKCHWFNPVCSTIYLSGMGLKNKKNAHLYSHQGATFIRHNKLSRQTIFFDDI